jgi:hypothetical protein
MIKEKKLNKSIAKQGQEQEKNTTGKTLTQNQKAGTQHKYFTK